jgi:hypothetical protein
MRRAARYDDQRLRRFLIRSIATAVATPAIATPQIPNKAARRRRSMCGDCAPQPERKTGTRTLCN